MGSPLLVDSFYQRLRHRPSPITRLSDQKTIFFNYPPWGLSRLVMKGKKERMKKDSIYQVFKQTSEPTKGGLI